MEKKIVIISAIALLFVCGLWYAYSHDWFYRASGQDVRYMAEIDAANSIVWHYGNLDPGRGITINYKKVKEFTEETIGDKENQYEYHAIVILDFDGKMDVSDEELLLIKDYCEIDNMTCCIMGLSTWNSFGITVFSRRWVLRNMVLLITVLTGRIEADKSST